MMMKKIRAMKRERERRRTFVFLLLDDVVVVVDVGDKQINSVSCVW